MVNFNGNIIPLAAVLMAPAGRGLRYGDGLFESIRVFDGETPFWPAHWQRLQQGFRVLKFDVPRYFTDDFFQKEINKLTGGLDNHRLRLTVWRGGEGLYTPTSSSRPVFLIETSPLRADYFVTNELGLHIGTCPEVHLPKAENATNEHYVLPNLKTCNALPFVLAGIWRKENELDDCLLLNTAGHIACGGSANVFLWKNGALITPPLSEGCVAGTMRAAIFELSKQLEIKLVEAEVLPGDLPQADEIFLTNAISGIRWVRQVEGVEKVFQGEKTAVLLAEINRRL